MNTKITSDQRTLNILKRAIMYGFELEQEYSMAANVAAAEETLIEEIGYDRIEVIDTDRQYSHVSYDDGHGYHYDADGEFINSGIDRNKNDYYERYGDGTLFRETSLADHNTGDIIYVRMYDVVDSNAEVVALVAKYEV